MLTDIFVCEDGCGQRQFPGDQEQVSGPAVQAAGAGAGHRGAAEAGRLPQPHPGRGAPRHGAQLQVSVLWQK